MFPFTGLLIVGETKLPRHCVSLRQTGPYTMKACHVLLNYNITGDKLNMWLDKIVSKPLEIAYSELGASQWRCNCSQHGRR